MSIPGIKIEGSHQLPQVDLRELFIQTISAGTVCLNALLKDPALNNTSKQAIEAYIDCLDNFTAQLNPERSATSSQEESGLDTSPEESVLDASPFV